MKRLIAPLATLGCLLFCTVIFAADNATLVQSPNGKLSATLKIDDAGASYTVAYDGKEIVAPSKLGLKFKDQKPFSQFRVIRVDKEQASKPWVYPWGRQKNYLDKYNLATVWIAADENREFRIAVRAYDDGIAIRYLFDAKAVGGKNYTLEADLTEFNFPADYDCWFTSYKGFKTSQEEFFPKGKLSAIKPGAFVGCPVTIQAGEKGPYVALTEADNNGWGGLFFEGAEDGKPRVKAKLAIRNDGDGVAKGEVSEAGARYYTRRNRLGRVNTYVVPSASGAAVSPWRVLIVSPTAIGLVDQTIVMNVSTPIDSRADFSWIKPGCASWDWWSDSNKVMNTDTIKGFIDLAAEMGWPYMFVDDPWYAGKKYKMGDPRNNVLKANDDIDMDAVLKHAKSKGIRLFLWLHWEDVGRQLDEAFALYEKWGIAGVKIDFMDREDQEMVEWYDMVTQKAAKHKLMVDFHGAFKPNGYRRAHPNLITREGVRGNEYNKWSKLTPEHYCTIPYTRMMLGPGDFTPGSFLNRYYDGPLVEGVATAQGIGTRAHELAVSLIYDSPILCLCDCPAVYKDQPGLEFYRNLPTVWDESRGVDGEIGKYFSLLRKKGSTWYYGAITNTEARTLKLSLDFLGRGNYEANIFADTPETDKDARKISVTTKKVTAADTLEVKLGREGGQTIIFKKLP